MTWARQDDGILDNPKIAAVGLLGYGWYSAGNVYCSRNLTDGFIPWGVARKLAPIETVDTEMVIWQVAATSGMAGYDGEELVEKLIEWLVNAGLWEEVPGGYLVHDFLDWNPSKAAVIEAREQKRAAGQAGGKAAARARATAGAKADAQAESKPTPIPTPTPIPEQEEDLKTAPSASNGNPNQPTEDQQYLLRRLFEGNPNWSEVTIPALVDLNKRFGRSVVRTALGRLRETMPTARKPYGLLVAACAEVASEESA